MQKEIYRYVFAEEVDPADVESALLLAVWGAESLYGESQVRLDAAHSYDPEQHICVLDAGTEVGRDLNRLFVGYLSRELDVDSFRVERVAERREPARV